MAEPLAVVRGLLVLGCCLPAARAQDPLAEAEAAAERGEDRRVLRLCLPLLEREASRARAARLCGPSAVRVCRSGDELGRPALARIASLWPQSASALANLALGDRLLGRYASSTRLYARAAALGGRSAWILNDWALVLLARGQREAALALLVEGGRAEASPLTDRNTCRTNAALVLLARAEAGDAARARALLQIVVAGAERRLRAAFWLAELDHPRGLRPKVGLGGRGRGP